MNIEKKLENGKLSVSVSGRLDTNTSPELETALKLDGVSELALDISGLEYLSSAGLRVLLAAQKTINAAGGRMSIANANETVKGVFDITGCSEIFTLV